MPFLSRFKFHFAQSPKGFLRALLSPTPLGRRGERLAARFLRRARYRILARNARTPVGEADLICEDPDGRTIVFVEVKTRALRAVRSFEPDAPARGPAAAHDPTPRPEAGVTARKRRKLLAVARDLARRRGWDRRPLRIDVIAVELPPEGRPIIRHHRGAVRR